MAKHPNLTRTSLRTLTRLTRAAASVSAEIERGLKAAGLPALAWHDVLGELAGAPEQRLRPADIGAALVLAQYNLSRLLDRIAETSLIRRTAVEGDGRGQWVVLTVEGANMHGRLQAFVAGAASAQFSAQLDGDEIKKLGKLLRRLAPEPPAPQNAAT